MRIAQGPAKGNINGAVLQEGRAIIAAAGHAVLHGNLLCAGHGEELLYQRVWNDIGIVYGTHHKSLSEDGVSKALGFKRRIRADKSINRKDVVGRLSFGSQPFGYVSSSHQTDFF